MLICHPKISLEDQPLLINFCRQMDFSLFPQLGKLRGDPDCSKDLYDTHVSRNREKQLQLGHFDLDYGQCALQ